MIWLVIMENHPWSLWCSLITTEYGRWGEWAWVGRDYDRENLTKLS
jgi:hypothetical protein